jgi:hypothetical protein
MYEFRLHGTNLVSFQIVAPQIRRDGRVPPKFDGSDRSFIGSMMLRA